MRAWKRILALTLSIAMIFGCLSVGSYATNEAFDFVVTKVEKYSEETHAILEGEIASAKPGEVIVATVSIVNNTDEDVEVGSYGVGLKYDEKVLTPYTDSAAPKKTPFCKGISYDVSGSNFIAGVKEQGLVKPTGATADGVTVEGRSSTELGKIAFKVAANAEKANTLFQIDDTLDDNELSNCDKVALTFKAGEPFSLFINGVAPKLDKVTVTDKDNNTVLDTSDRSKTFGRLEVNGTTDYTYQARAWSTSGKEITEKVTWKLKSGSNLYDELNGATISEAGLLTIPRDAGAELSGNFFSFWVVATPKDGVSGNAIETNNIQINHEEQEIKTIQISRKEGETGALIIPGTGESAATAEFVATCTNQYGKPYTGDQPIYWSYGRKDTNKGVSGITMNGAVLSVSSDAKNVENGSVVLVVTATTGSGTEKVTSKKVEITVQRDTVQRPAKIEVSDTVSTLAVPKTGDPTATATATYTATVYDQYGTEITDPGAISWYLEADDESQPFGTGNESQFIVMKEAAQTFAEGSTSREITIKAICGGVSDTTTLTLTREKARAMRIAMEDITIAVPKSDEANVTRSYLEVYDQYDIKMGSPTFEKTTTPNTLNGVTFTDDKITVSSDAAGNDFNEGKCQFTLTITCNSASTDIVSETKTITLTRQQAEATSFDWVDDGINNRQAVPHRAGEKVPASVKVTVRDQYGQKMTDAEVQPNGALPTGIILENGKLYITKDAVDHFNGVRGDSTKGIRVSLKSGNAQVTVTVHLKLADAQTNPQSAEISGQNKIARPTDDTPNTAEYSIGAIVDQYGLPITFEPEKLEMELTDKNGFAIADSKNVTLSKGENGNWIISVTKDAATQQTYVLMAKYKTGGYDAIQCAPVKEITIVDKTVRNNTLTVTQGDFTYGEEGKLNPVVKKDGETITNATFVYAKDGQTVTEVKDAGKYTVTATCEDANYIYTGSVDFQILPKEIKVGWIELDGTRYTYNGREQTVKYTVKDGNTTLVKDRDYTVEGDKQTNAGVHLLKIIGTGNYTSNFTAAAGAPSVNWNIRGLPVRISTAAFQSRAYAKDNYSAELDTLTLVAAEDGVTMPDTLTAGNGFTVSDIRVTNNNAGRQPVSFKVTLTNTNYKWAVAETGNTFDVDERAGFKVEITKANHAAETVSAEGKYGNQLAIDLSQVLPEGWSATVAITENTNAVLTEIHGSAMYIMEQDGKLWLQLTNDSNKVGKDATVTLTVNSTNYNPFTITVTVTVQNKKTQTVTANDLNVTYGDAGVKLNASALDNAKLTYQVTKGTDVVAVDANGNVTLRKSGTAKIQITAAETEDYGTANTTVTVTVAKRSLTVKANDLTAYVGGQLPALDYTVTGLVSGDTLTTVPELELKDVPAGVDPMKTAGTYTIGFKTAPVADPDKYDLTVETGTLTVSSRPNVNPVPAGNSVKLEEAAGGKLTSSVSRATKGTTVTITVKPDAGYRLEELEVLDKNGEALPLKELANGKFSFQMPDSKVTVQASFVQESTYAGYPDVLPQDWFYSSVRYVTERGLMNGTPNGFEPNMDSSRATIWTILARFSGVDTTVVSGEWYAVARQWAMENGVSDGTNPNGVITREQLATMLYRFAKNKGLVQEPVTADLSVFVDAGQISDYALDAMRWAVSVGLLNGMDGSRLAPQGSAARAQVAAMLMRFDQLAK